MKELISRYFDAFYRLYGIIPLKQAYRIIARQNPELNITKEDFADVVSHIDTDKKHYVLWSEDELYYELYDEPYDPSKNTDIFDKMLVGEHIVIFDDADYYEDLVSQQEGRAFYVPEKQELLKYDKDCYYEKSKYYYAMENFIRDELKLESCYEDVADEIATLAVFFDSNIDEAIDSLRRLSHKQFKNFADVQQGEKFAKLYSDLYNHTRKEILRGRTPYEAGECVYYEYSVEDEQEDLDVSPVALSKNRPCPCGSGKRFKHCCMGKGVYD